MKKILIIFYITLFAITLQAQGPKNTDVSKYYLIRHAEKIKSKGPDPVLHSKGEERAKAWVGIFKDISFDAVYSTDYIRTRNTVIPIAKSWAWNLLFMIPERLITTNS